MKRYPKYKLSGDEWIGDIPEHWMVKRIKHLCEIQGRIGYKGYKSSDLVLPNEGAITLGATHLTKDNTLNLDEPVFLSWDKYFESPEIMVKPGDVVFSQRGTLGLAAYIDKDYGPMTINPSLVLLKGIKINAKFFAKFLSSSYIMGNVNIISSSTAVPMISQEQLSNFYILVPPPEEQIQISFFLDEELKQLDSLISKKQHLIELLLEEKTAIINEAVTKGLNPDVKMKDSGIPWLEEIPEYWMSKKLKYLTQLINEKIDKEAEYVISLENIEGNTGKIINISYESKFEGELRKFQPNDVLFNKLRPYLAKVHLAEKEGCCIGELLVLRAKNELLPKFLFYRLISSNFINVVNSSTYGSKMPRASWEDFISQLYIPYPDLIEQKAIVNYLDLMVDKCSQTLLKVEKEISLLQEYRTALISEVVTGKLDVRNITEE